MRGILVVVVLLACLGAMTAQETTDTTCYSNCETYVNHCGPSGSKPTALCLKDYQDCRNLCSQSQFRTPDYASQKDVEQAVANGDNAQQVYQAELKDTPTGGAAAPAPPSAAGSSEGDGAVVCEGDDGSSDSSANPGDGTDTAQMEVDSEETDSAAPKKTAAGKKKAPGVKGVKPSGAFCHWVPHAALKAAGIKVPSKQQPHDLSKPLQLFKSPLLSKLNSHVVASHQAALNKQQKPTQH